MFIRWHRRPRINRWSGKITDVHWGVALTASVRVGGKPRQRHVAYLGGITESRMQSVHQRCWFWDQVSERLYALDNQMTNEDRNRIIAEIAAKVPMPSRDEHAKSHRAARAMFKDWYTAPSHPLYDPTQDGMRSMQRSARATSVSPARQRGFATCWLAFAAGSAGRPNQMSNWSQTPRKIASYATNVLRSPRKTWPTATPMRMQNNFASASR
jgi:hypothetical protein